MFDVLFRMFAAGDSAVPATGMQAISDQLAAGLPDGAVRLDTPVRSVRADGVVTEDGADLAASAVVVATDGVRAAELTPIERPGSRGSTTMWFAAERAPIDEPVLLLDGDGCGPAQSAAVISNVAPDYALAGGSLVVASIAGTTAPDLEEAVRTQLTGWFGPAVRSWRLLREDRIAHALPEQSVPTSPKRNARLTNGVYICGDHRDTASIQGALFSGRRAAATLVAGNGGV